MKAINSYKINIILVVLILIFQSQSRALSQNAVRFTCYEKSPCLSKPVLIKDYSLSNSDTLIHSNDSGVCYIPKLGTYHWHSFVIQPDIKFPDITFTFFGNVVDTIEDYTLGYIAVVCHYNSTKKSIRKSKRAGALQVGDWVYCGRKADGLKTDYYVNGNKRVEGKFKNGKPIGEVKYYDTTGKLNYIEYYTKRGKEIKAERIKADGSLEEAFIYRRKFLFLYLRKDCVHYTYKRVRFHLSKDNLRHTYRVVRFRLTKCCKRF